MSAFTRFPATTLVCLFRPHAPQATRLAPSRAFRSFAPLRHGKKPALYNVSATPVPRQSPAKLTPAKPAAPSRTPALPGTAYGYIKQLAQRGSPTTLYEAPSHAWMKFGSWSTALFSFAYGGYTMSFYFSPPPGLAWWVGPSYSIIGIAFATVGTVFLLRTSGIVKTVRALPEMKGGAGMTPRLNLEVTVKSTLPFVKPAVLVVPCGDVALKSRIVAPMEFMSPLEKVERKKEEAVAKENKRKYEMAHLFTAPFRHAGRGARSAIRGTTQLFTGGGFGSLNVDGKSYRLDVTNAWMLDEGRALDRLVRVVGIDESRDSKWARIYK
ncbi:hypothetical protein IMZ48_47790 [Candidatus Bathyarchaeota archaeon]|nr:hypothetical protein [Candidatus Bathyarchaeota archaeon]